MKKIREIRTLYQIEIQEFLNVILPEPPEIINVSKPSDWYVDVTFELHGLIGKVSFYQNHIDNRDLVEYRDKSHIDLMTKYFYEAKGFVHAFNPFIHYNEEDMR